LTRFWSLGADRLRPLAYRLGDPECVTIENERRSAAARRCDLRCVWPSAPSPSVHAFVWCRPQRPSPPTSEVPRVRPTLRVAGFRWLGAGGQPVAAEEAALSQYTFGPPGQGETLAPVEAACVQAFADRHARPNPTVHLDRNRTIKSRRGAGDEARTRDPFLGKVACRFRIRQRSKMASRRLLTPNFDGDPRQSRGTPCWSHRALIEPSAARHN
jgi:hypothetical protein